MYKIINQLIGSSSVQAQVVQTTKPNPIKNITENNSGLKDLFKIKIQDNTPGSITSFIFTTILGLAGSIFMIMMLVGGFTYLTGAGNEEKTSKAKKLMIDAVIGIILTASAYGTAQFIIGQLSGS